MQFTTPDSAGFALAEANTGDTHACLAQGPLAAPSRKKRTRRTREIGWTPAARAASALARKVRSMFRKQGARLDLWPSETRRRSMPYRSFIGGRQVRIGGVPRKRYDKVAKQALG